MATRLHRMDEQLVTTVKGENDEFQKPSLIQAMNRFLEKDELFVKDYDKVGFVKELILK